jgi:hypothetical protein
MSDLHKINDALDRIFLEEEARTVFWNDRERQFLNVLPFLMLDDVTAIRLDQSGALGLQPVKEPDHDPASSRIPDEGRQEGIRRAALRGVRPLQAVLADAADLIDLRAAKADEASAATVPLSEVKDRLGHGE